MTTDQLLAGNAMHAALKNLPCRCEHNVLYAGMQVEQTVTRMCARCRSMAAWQLATTQRPQASKQPSPRRLDGQLASLLTEALDELFEVTRDPDRQRSETESVRESIHERATALVSHSATEAVS